MISFFSDSNQPQGNISPKVAACAVVSYSLLLTVYSTMSAAIGASALSHHYDNYNPKQASGMGAAGGSLIGVLWGLTMSSCCGKSDNKFFATFAQCVIFAELSGLAGYGVAHAAYDQPHMNCGQMAAASAVGSACLVLPFLVIYFCCIKPCCGSLNEKNAQSASLV